MKNYFKIAAVTSTLFLGVSSTMVTAGTPKINANDAFQSGFRYDTGKGAVQDFGEAAKWYKIAASLGQRDAQKNLADMYASGRGVSKDQTEAKRLYRLAADQGVADAQYLYGRWYGANTEEQVQYLKLAAQQGHKDATTFLAGIKVEPVKSAPLPDDSFNFKIGKNVPELDIKTIKDGLVLIQKHLNDEYGGAIPLAVQKNIRVRIEASGKGDKQEGGGSPAATSIGPKAPRLYFDVKHPQWNQDSSGRGWTTISDNMLVAAHEYVHAWHANLSGNKFPYGGWINEGLAVYISYDAMIKAGKMSKSDVDRFVTDGAFQSKETSSPLKDYWKDSVWPGHVGYVAINWLVAESPKGKLSLRVLGTDIAAGMSTKAAFADAFDIELDEFYKQFEFYRKIINANPIELAIKARPYLTNSHEAGGMSDQYEFNITIDKTTNIEVMALDGKNRPVWKSGPMVAKRNLFTKTNLFTVKMPKAKVKNAIKFCVFLAKGWIVRDQAGKAYSASCGDIGSLSLRSFGYELKVEKQ